MQTMSAGFLAGALGDRRGAILVLFALLLPVLLGFIGLAVETARNHDLQQSAAAALETALRSACAIDNTDPNENLARNLAFFNANYKGENDIEMDDIETTLTGNKVTITVPSLVLNETEIEIEVAYPTNCR